MQDNPNPDGDFERPDLTAMFRIAYGLGADVQSLLADALRFPAVMMRHDGRENTLPTATADAREIDRRLAAAMAGLAANFTDAAAMYSTYADESEADD